MFNDSMNDSMSETQILDEQTIKIEYIEDECDQNTVILKPKIDLKVEEDDEIVSNKRIKLENEEIESNIKSTKANKGKRKNEDKKEIVDELNKNRKESLLDYDPTKLNVEDIKMSPKEIASKLREKLDEHQIPRRLFSKALLNNDSEYLKHYLYRIKRWDAIQRDWVRLNVIKLYMWLIDPHGLDKLKEWQKLNVNNNIECEEKINKLQPIELNETNKSINIDICKNEMSVKDIVDNIKNVLKLNKITHDLFSRSLFGSEYHIFKRLIRNPLEWDRLKCKNDESYYYKMYLWLKDENRLKKFYNWNNNEQELNINLGNLYQHYYQSCLNYEKYVPNRIENETSTEKIATLIKDKLRNENLKQSQISLPILKTNRGLSLMLNEPKSWSENSKLVNLRFKLLFMWLKDDEGIEKIHKLKETPADVDKSKAINKNLLPNLHMYVRITKQQSAELEKLFKINKYPSDKQINCLVKKTHLTRDKIVRWFGSKRQKVQSDYKKNKKIKKILDNDNNECESSSSSTSSDSSDNESNENECNFQVKNEICDENNEDVNVDDV